MRYLVAKGCGLVAVCLLASVFGSSAQAAGDPVAEIDGRKISAIEIYNAYAAERPEIINQIRIDDNAARTLAMDWYRAELFARAAADEGFGKAQPATVAQADRIRAQFLAAEYLTWLLKTKYEPSMMEMAQLYKMQPALCAGTGKVRLARLGVVWGRNAGPEEIAAAEARFAAMQARLEAGESFGAVADDASDFMTSGTGGDTGWLEIKAFKGAPMGEKILALAPGDRSEVIRLPDSLGMFEMLAFEEPGTLSLEACEDRLAEELSKKFRIDVRRRRINELAAKYNASLNMDAFIAVVRSIPAPGDPRVPQKLP